MPRYVDALTKREWRYIGHSILYSKDSREALARGTLLLLHNCIIGYFFTLTAFDTFPLL